MQIESDEDETLPHRNDQEKDRAKDNNQVQDMEEDSSDEEDIAPPGESQKSKNKGDASMQPPPLPPTPGNVIVKKGYDPKQQGKFLLHLMQDGKADKCNLNW